MTAARPPIDLANNPAVPCPELAALLPERVAAADLVQPVTPGSLLAAEAHRTAQWSQKRRQDFAAGRVCARRAMHQFGLGDFALRTGPDGLPVWPAGLTGSITHTSGYAAAVVGPRTCVLSLGIDSERTTAVTEEVWPVICTPAEYSSLREAAPATRLQRAGLLFAAKEAFYKCQYPLTGEWIEFGEVAVAVHGNLASSGEFEILPGRPLMIRQQHPLPFSGRYRFHDPFVTAVMALPA